MAINKKTFLSFILKHKNLLLICLVFVGMYCYINYNSNNLRAKSLDVSSVSALNEKYDEISIGDKNAKVNVIEYADFFCSHCVHTFRRDFDKLYNDYILKHKARFIFRPLVLSKQSLDLAKFLMCKKRTEDEYVKLLKLLFNLYSLEFRKTKDPMLMVKNYLSDNGIDVTDFYQCIGDNAIEQKVMNIRQYAISHGINGTPYVFVNDIVAGENLFLLIDKLQ